VRMGVSRELAGRVAVVTGVTAGIGREVAGRLLAGGTRVVGCARDGERLQVVAAKLPGLVPVACDVRVAAQRSSLVDLALDRYGRIDVLVNNAGIGFYGAVVDMAATDIERIIQTNVTGLIDLTRLVLPDMTARHDGDVLVVSSAATWVSLPPLTVYAASKYAVDGFVQGLRREVGPHGVRVHSVNPGFVSTEFLARSLRYQPQEDDPGVEASPGFDPERVARVVERELRHGRGRTVTVPRILGVGRILGVPPVSHLTDVAVRLSATRLERLGRQVARERTPAVRSAGRRV
jgi:NADP-dependent 3-hydroxy acid dehydrogenase YdfG